MQLPPFGLVLLLLLLIGVIIAIRSRKSTIVPRCSYCGAQSLLEIDRVTMDTRTVDLHSNKFLPGADIRLQLDQRVTYRCRDCHKTTQINVTETP